MTIVGTHRGPVSGLVHIHLLRESAAVRTRRSADPEERDVTGTENREGGGTTARQVSATENAGDRA